MTPESSLGTVLLIGSTGQLGRELARVLRPNARLLTTARSNAPQCPGADFNLDLNDEAAIRQCMRDAAPDVVVNTAAFTQVDLAESEVILARALNTRAPQVIAQEADRLGCLMVHYSTDYVFDGESDVAYVERSPTRPINVYGQTKCDGELAVQETCARHVVFRTSWIYAGHGKNFVRTIFERASNRDVLRVVDDQTGSPTSAAALAQATTELLLRAAQDQPSWLESRYGLYHLSARGRCTWYELAVQIAGAVSKTLTVEPIASCEYPTAAARPMFSVLDCTRAHQRLGLELPGWREQLTPVLLQLSRSESAHGR